MKLNLGSGITGPAALNIITLDRTGWKFIDICQENNPHECYDITDGIQEPDNSVELIWMGDCFEHIMRGKSMFVLEECFRVLQSDGKLLISVPDMVVVMPKWLESNGEDPSHTELIWGCQGGDGMRNALGQTHFNGFTEISLTKKLQSVRFRDIKRIGIHKNWCELAVEAYK